MTNSKYPNWIIEKDKWGYTMNRPDWEKKGVFYMIAVSQDDNGKWWGELLTLINDRYSSTGTSWEPLRKPYGASVPRVAKEAERRAAYWMAQD